ncbi:MAG TPA: YciI family protein [Xanthobacteraceae bacterium]|nr:YciI family protein [Xanthobacteraceae bacterium]
MSEFLFLFRGSNLQARSPEQMQESIQKWVAWFKELNEKGVIKEPGNPLDRSGKVVRGHGKDVHDGPYAEAKDLVNGYLLVETATIDQAVALARGCPIFEDGGSVEVRPIMKF